MIRPKYYKGDRGGIVHFPLLKQISLCIHTGVSYLPEWGYNAPELQHIVLLIDPEFARFPSRWQMLKTAQRNFNTYKKLETITAVIASNNDQTRKITPWEVLRTPKIISWEIARLLFIGKMKEGEDCGFSKLPMELIHQIVGWLSEGWQIDTLNSDLPKEFENFPPKFFVV